MKFKGLTISLVVVLTGISLYHLTLTWVTNRVEREATAYATDDQGRVNYAKRREYLHLKESKVVFSFLGFEYTYAQTKARSPKKGTDIDGGVVRVLVLDELAELKKMVRSPNAKVFLKAIRIARKRSEKNPKRKMTDHFCDVIQEINPNEPLADMLLTKYLPKELGINPTDDAIRVFLRSHMRSLTVEGQKALAKRLSGIGGLGNIDIYQNKQGQVVIELPGDDQEDRVTAMIAKQGDLALYIVVEDQQLWTDFMTGLQELLNEGLGREKGKENLKINDLFLFTPNGILCKEESLAKLDTLLEEEEVVNLLHEDVAVFVGSKVEQGKYRRVYFLKKGARDVNIKSARDVYDKQYVVEVRFDYASGKEFERLTAAYIGKIMAIVIDGRVQVAASIQQKIAGGTCRITGDYTADQARDLAYILSSEMNAKFICIEKSAIGAEFAEEEKNQSLYVLFLALLAILLFMLLYYAVGGFVANVALLLNMLFILGILSSFGAVLTLPGIAGIVLTIGMSIDATVIIFASILAEQEKGVYIVDAIRRGYTKAYRVIMDSNITTLLTGVILYNFGTGVIKSFATTLIIGIFTSLFCAVLVTRLLIEAMIRIMNPERISFRLFSRSAKLSSFKFDFLGKRKYSYTFSLLLIGGGFFSIYYNELDRGVEFTGGRVYICQFDAPVSVPKLKGELGNQFNGKSVDIKTYGSNAILRITTNFMLEKNSIEADKKVQEALIAGIEKITGKRYIGTQNRVKTGTFSIPSNSKIMATAAEDIKSSAWIALLLALLMILLYIFLSFRSMSLAIAALVALLHDVLMLFAGLGIAKAFGISYELDLVFVSSVLTILGYSVNDTVVVYAYIVGLQPSIRGKGIRDLVNPAINNTLNRTLPTSLTTLIPIVTLYFFGGKGLEPMAFSLLIGVIFGTYSSIFIAAPLAADLMDLVGKKNTKKRALTSAKR